MKKYHIKIDEKLKQQLKNCNLQNVNGMYMLIRIGTNDSRSVELVSKTKGKLENHIKENGYCWSKKANRYIDDRTSGIDGGSGTDYLIHSGEELV